MIQNDFIHILADAIQEHEGWLESTGKAWPNLNPGNLHNVGQPGAGGNFGDEAKFDSFYDGKQAQLNDLKAKLNGGLNTIAKIITRYAPPHYGNDTAAYIAAVVKFFAARNFPIGADDDIPSYIANSKVPSVLVVINRLFKPLDWAAIQAAIAQCAKFMSGYTFSCRYSDTDLSASVIKIPTVIGPETSVIDGNSTQKVIMPYAQGQTMAVMIYDGAVMQGHPEPAGGCEWQQFKIAPVSAIASVIYEGPAFENGTARILFHELIHELFTLTEQKDSLHEYLEVNGGYLQNSVADLEAVFTGNKLNTPGAVFNLEIEAAKVANGS